MVNWLETISPKTRTYQKLEMVAIPEDIPEPGVKSGDEGVIATIYDDRRMPDVEIGREDGSSAGFVDPKIGGDGAPHVVGYSLLGD